MEKFQPGCWRIERRSIIWIRKAHILTHTSCFLFKLVFSFPYVNSRAGISARAEFILGWVNFIFGPVNFIFGPVYFIFGPVNFIFGPVNFIFGPFNFNIGPIKGLVTWRNFSPAVDVLKGGVIIWIRKAHILTHTSCFLFKLVFSFPYVNSRAGISARAEFILGWVNFIFGPVNFIFGPVYFIFGPVNFIFGPVNFIFGPFNFNIGPIKGLVTWRNFSPAVDVLKGGV